MSDPTPTPDKLPETPRTDGFEIVIAGESPILGNRYRAWSGFARDLERELAALTADRDAVLRAVDYELLPLQFFDGVDPSVLVYARSQPVSDRITSLVEWMRHQKQTNRDYVALTETAQRQQDTIDAQSASLTQLRAENERVKKDYFDVADALCRESKSPEDLCNQARALRVELEWANRTIEGVYRLLYLMPDAGTGTDNDKWRPYTAAMNLLKAHLNPQKPV